METLSQFSEAKLIDVCIEALDRSLPDVFSRKTAVEHLGGVLSHGTLANLQCLGFGPPSIRSGRNTVYEKTSFLLWFRVFLTGGTKSVSGTFGEKTK